MLCSFCQFEIVQSNILTSQLKKNILNTPLIIQLAKNFKIFIYNLHNYQKEAEQWSKFALICFKSRQLYAKCNQKHLIQNTHKWQYLYYKNIYQVTLLNSEDKVGMRHRLLSTNIVMEIIRKIIWKLCMSIK